MHLSQAVAVLQGRTASILIGLVCSFASMDGVKGNLVVAMSSASVWGSSLEEESLLDCSVSVALSESESEQGSVASVPTDVSSSSWVIVGAGALFCLSLVEPSAWGWA